MRLFLSLFLCLFVPFLIMGQAPVANFTANVTTGCSPLSVSFTDQSTGSPKSWNWDFGNGQLSNAQNPSIGFGVGTYTVTLVVRNANGIDQITKTGYITVNPSPTVNFKANQTLACLPATVQFTDMSVANAGTINQWEWHFNDGGLNINTQNPSHSYVNPGYYDVYLKVTSTTGCSAALNLPRYIRVVNGVKADFNAVGPTTCSPPFTMNYKNLTSGPGILTYAWDLGNGTTSSVAEPPATYAAAGTYTIKLKAQSEFGCADSTQKNIPVKGVASTFTSTPATAVCIGAPVAFQSTTTPAPVKVIWDFGDGTGSTDLKPPPKSYATAGSYLVKLVSNFGNCNDTLIKNVTVSDKPLVDFTAANTSSCKAPLTTTFQDLSPDAVSWKWDFGDGSPSGTGKTPSHTYNKLGNFDVTLTITNSGGCQNTITKKGLITIVAPTVYNDGGPSGVCVGKPYIPISFIGAIDGVASYAWTFGDGGTSNIEIPSHTYATAGTYTVKLTIVTNGGCMQSNTTTVEVGTPPNVNFSADKSSACRSEIVTFTNLTTGAAANSPVLWSFGDTSTSTLQNPLHKYTDTGYFNVKLKVTNNGCSDSLTIANMVHALPPLANFGYKLTDCTNKTNITFSDSTLNDPAYGILFYKWDFGDGTPIDITPNPVHPYPGLNAYTVKLIVNNNSCADTVTKTVQLIDEKADFTLAGNRNKFCRNEYITITSTNNPAYIKRYQWIIDGGAPTDDNGSIALSFSNTGTHTVQLIVTDINNCVSLPSAIKSFDVTGPTAVFGVKNNGGCKGSTIAFLDTSFSTGTINKWTFDFGDGNVQAFNGVPFMHQYADTGVFNVMMIVNDNLGCQDTARKVITITKPTAFFSTAQTTFCPGAPLPFKDSSSGKGLQYSWDFGDGGTDNVQNPVHSYPAGKDSIYSVKLIVTDTVGCSDSLTRSSYITTKGPKPLYSAKDTVSLCPPLETKFTFKGQDFESFSWDFGDGGTSTLVNTSHFYNTYGTYIAKLYTVGYGGCIDSASIPVSVLNPNAASSLTYTPNPAKACNELTVNFALTVPAFTAFTVFFGDGTYDTTHQPTFSHFYSLPNNYGPYIFLTDSTGCQASVGGASGTIQIQGAVPLFGMDKNKFCDTGAIFFSDYSQDAIDPIVSKTWNFGDGTAPGPLPASSTHTYTQAGLYVPTLAVTTQAGCTQTFTDTVRVLATPKPVITSINTICKGLMIDFAGSLLVPPDTAISWKWSLGENQVSNLQNISIKYADSGIHHITLEASNSLGCKGDTSKDVIVNPLPAITINGDTTLIAGASGIVMPITYSANATTFNWTPPTYLSCTDCASPFANPKFTTTYNVKVTDANGCINSRNVTLLVVCNNKNFFIPNTFSPNNDGSNDRFYPRGTGLDRIQALRIFNRWGELVFEKRNFPANDAASGWDGTYRGKTASTDTYIYMIDIICENANIITYKGNVTLIR